MKKQTVVFIFLLSSFYLFGQKTNKDLVSIGFFQIMDIAKETLNYWSNTVACAA